MSLLGDDGRGYELARKLEALGVWRTWLGDSLYSTFLLSLSSPATWDSFMRADDSKSKSLLQLQLRVRALLFDKACVSLFLRSKVPYPSPTVAVSNLNPNYLQLHGDDVYFTLEDGDQRREVGGGAGVGASTAAPSKSHAKHNFGVGSRIAEAFKNDELPETWYSQFIEKYKVSRPYRLSFVDRESEKRSSEEMSNYLVLRDKHKRRRVAFKQDQFMSFGNSSMGGAPNVHPSSVLDGYNSAGDDDAMLFPETMFMSNCVPESALPLIIREPLNKKIEFHGVFDALPQIRSPVRIERLGISVEQGGNLHRGKNGSEGNRKLLSQEQASMMSQKVVSRMLARVGFESATEVPLEVLSQLLRCHICKLGRTLKFLADSYKKQCSAIELLKMFLQNAGNINFSILMELVKDGTKHVMQPTQQQVVHGIQPQLQSQNQAALRLSQQVQMQRQMHPQTQQMVHPQNLSIHQQQQLQMERLRRRQQLSLSTPRPVVDMDKDRPLVQVKLENPPELPLDGNAFGAMHSRHPQMQYRQQQLAAISSLHAQSSNQFRQLASMQIPQMHSPSMSSGSMGSVIRAPPVKVEGFQELMGGDASLKHDSEESKLTSPSSK